MNNAKEILRQILIKLRCVCCQIPAEEWDHIIPRSNYRSKFGKRKGLSWETKLLLFNRGSLQPICHQCNISKRASPNCRIHNKYIGVWIRLPNLYNMEESNVN